MWLKRSKQSDEHYTLSGQQQLMVDRNIMRNIVRIGKLRVRPELVKSRVFNERFRFLVFFSVVFRFLRFQSVHSRTRYTGNKNTTKKYTKIIQYTAIMNVTKQTNSNKFK